MASGRWKSLALCPRPPMGFSPAMVPSWAFERHPPWTVLPGVMGHRTCMHNGCQVPGDPVPLRGPLPSLPASSLLVQCQKGKDIVSGQEVPPPSMDFPSLPARAQHTSMPRALVGNRPNSGSPTGPMPGGEGTWQLRRWHPSSETSPPARDRKRLLQVPSREWAEGPALAHFYISMKSFWFDEGLGEGILP